MYCHKVRGASGFSCVLQYKIRCFLMLKSLKSCKREMKALVGSQGPVSVSLCAVHCHSMHSIYWGYTDRTVSCTYYMLLSVCFILSPNRHVCCLCSVLHTHADLMAVLPDHPRLASLPFDSSSPHILFNTMSFSDRRRDGSEWSVRKVHL